ncbi:hypothetical protein CCR94_07350 [Rhodoblastus sphagnicola]|uniref:DUF1614 domain-containing protein n=1 Tax=Rhodoblastus sphagnicola TaxID=333368 RepID=A0A2S6NBM5_9HYPH|nr:DUF1614 domain-containing protein [Rhodoblastus sphagnicola]MBB4199672.1 putative membrane protein [Rhodoblastus sphagnicola]PPQ32013.1 hypothetical protein CCR94_07350 [Rhodoblastus sphagnicola]
MAAHSAYLHYIPLAWPFLAILALCLGLLLLLVQIRILRFAYMSLGVSSGWALALLAASLLGSSIDIPIAELSGGDLVAPGDVSFLGMRYPVPEFIDEPGVVLAINVGGALIPTLLSLYLMATRGIWGRALVTTAVITVICHMLAQPVRGVGIALPIFVPPIAAALVAAIVSWEELAPLAYVGGSLGVLLGADVLNLGLLSTLGAPVASIGGAGTFDGIFVTGLLAALLASLSRISEKWPPVFG